MADKHTKRIKQQAERRDVIVRRVCVATWRKARIDALEKGIPMAAWIEAAIAKMIGANG